MALERSLRDLARCQLEPARELLARSCPFERAGAVAEELLFGPAPERTPRAIGAWDGERLCGVAVASGAWVRVLAVDPAARGQGVGSALLAAAEQAIASTGAREARVLDEPGNYLAPGVDLDDRDTIAWLLRRGYLQQGVRENLLVDVRTNPRVTPEQAQTLAGRCAGYTIRRASPGDRDWLTAAVRAAFSPAWAFEVDRALAHAPPGVHVAVTAEPAGPGDLAAFAAHDGNNQGLGWFGPAGTWPEHRGVGLGAALLLACLVDVAAAGHDTCEIAWIGPRAFYERVAGVAGERRFAAFTKELP